MTLLISSSIIIGVFWILGHVYRLNLGSFSQTSGKNNKRHSLKLESLGGEESTQIPEKKPTQATTGRFADVENVPSGIFRYGGSTTWAIIRSKTEGKIERAFLKYDLRYTNPIATSPDSGVGIKMLLNNELAFSQTSRSLKDKEHEAARMKGVTLTEIPVAIDGIAVAVNPDLSLPGITVKDLKKIYVGKISNWKELGGPNLKIIPYSKRNKGGTVEFFTKNVLQKEKFGNDIQTVETTTEALQKISQNRGGIFYASAPEIVRQCNVKPLPIGRVGQRFVPPYQRPLIPPSQCPARRNKLNIAAFKSDEYPMTRRLFVVVKNNGKIEEEAGEAYAQLMLTQEGQKLISEAGFVRIR
ncbi:PstS family phosphate ABC transporter substrate-binding protein [Mastigocoleus sp. MO_188.B34]|uniref:PstS family phosphate ABC transporter substrate-binding protein n=1 Tax=Mastigocoleus sp. MO_188.B34 TaxID=3036635 RepID=UPI0034528373